MKRIASGLVWLARSLYIRIALIYMISLVGLSAAVAWVAVSQFDQLGREWQQRTQVDLAHQLARVMGPPLRQGTESAPAQTAARHILSINPSLRLFVLDAGGTVVGDYAAARCGLGKSVNVAKLNKMLEAEPMLPVFAIAPCSGQPSVFSVAPVRYGKDRRSGYLFVVLDAGMHMSMFTMLRTSSITRTLLKAGALALLLSALLGLLLFALLARRFSRLTETVQRFADGDYGRRFDTTSNDEIGRLGRVFNDMAATIQAQLGALRENDRQRRDLVANLSHDFRTPLTSLRGYAQQLKDSDRLDPAARAIHLDAILANVGRLTRLARQLSLVARLDSGGSPLRIETFSLAELAQDVAGKFQPQAGTADVQLILNCDAARALVAADLALIDRALTNLVDNALAATPAGGEIRIGAEPVGSGMRVWVADTGIGLNADEIALVTQRFYRTRAGQARGDGSGLGLAIVAEICERHDTRLVIDSMPDRGTRMQFELALASSDGSSEGVTES